MGLERSLKPYEINYRSGGKFYADRRFVLEVAGSLSGTSLEEGDTLPEDATYRIIAANIVREKKTGLAQFIDVTAEKQVTSRTLLSQFSREEQHDGILYKHHTYQIALGSVLIANSIQESAALPDDANYRISHSQITIGGKSALANMAVVLAHKIVASKTELVAFQRDEERDGMLLSHRRYHVPDTGPMSRWDLEEGDVLPDDSACEIIHSQHVRMPRGGYYPVLVDIVARKFGSWAD